MPLITEPSICIPRTLHNVNWRNVKDTFETLLGKGTVERVDIVTDKRNESPFCRIFVHMRYWDVGVQSVADIRNRLMKGETIKVVYDNPWFWKCAKSRTTKPQTTRTRNTPYVEFAPKADSVPDSSPEAGNPAGQATPTTSPSPVRAGDKARHEAKMTDEEGTRAQQEQRELEEAEALHRAEFE